MKVHVFLMGNFTACLAHFYPRWWFWRAQQCKLKVISIMNIMHTKLFCINLAPCRYIRRVMPLSGGLIWVRAVRWDVNAMMWVWSSWRQQQVEVRDVLMTCIVPANEGIYFRMKTIITVFVFVLYIGPRTFPHFVVLFHSSLTLFPLTLSLCFK